MSTQLMGAMTRISKYVESREAANQQPHFNEHAHKSGVRSRLRSQVVAKVPLASLSQSQTQAWLKNRGLAAFCDSFMAAHVDGRMMCDAHAVLSAVDRRSTTSEQRVVLTKAIAKVREEGVLPLQLHHFGVATRRVGSASTRRAGGTACPTAAEASPHAPVHGSILDHITLAVDKIVLMDSTHAEPDVDITVHVTVPEAGAPKSGNLLVHVPGYISMLSVDIPAGCAAGQSFAVHTTKSHMDSLEGHGGDNGVLGDVNMEAFDYLHTTKTASEHPIDRVGRVLFRAVTNGRRGLPPPKSKPHAADRLRVVMLLVRCKLLARKWARRAKASAATAALTGIATHPEAEEFRQAEARRAAMEADPTKVVVSGTTAAVAPAPSAAADSIVPADALIAAGDAEVVAVDDAAAIATTSDASDFAPPSAPAAEAAAPAEAEAEAAEAAAAAAEMRVGDDGHMYSKKGFIAHYGGTVEWDEAASAMKRMSVDGSAAEEYDMPPPNMDMPPPSFSGANSL